MSVRILQGEVREMLRTLPAESVDCVVTSPPYWGLRSYLPDGHADKHLEIGCEPTLAEHLAVLVEVFGEVRRVMKPQASLWLNYGDCYATSPNGRSAAATKAAGNDDRTFRDKPFSTVGPICGQTESTDRRGKSGNKGAGDGSRSRIMAGGYLKPKDLCMVANRLAIALQDAGWWVRSEIVWGKNNPMPDSSGKYRPSTAHEKIFLLTKSAKSYYDAEAVALPCSENTNARRPNNGQKMPDNWDTGTGAHGSFHRQGREKGKTKQDGHGRRHAGFNDRWDRKMAESGSGIRNNESMDAALAIMPETRYLRNYEPAPLKVWEMATQPFSEAHFACVDIETEALTKTGWRSQSDLQDGDEIAAYDGENLAWQPATFHRYQYDGDLVVIEKRDSSQRLTPNHRCLVKRRTGAPVVVRADKLKPGMQIPTTAPLVTDETHGPGHAIAALLGWYLTEGEKKRGNIIRITQSESANPRNVERIRSLLFLLRADFSERRRERTWRGRPSIEIVFSVKGHIAEKLYSKSPDKTVDWAWLNWPTDQIQSFMDAVVDGDGHSRKDGRACVIQKRREFLDVLQALALRLGYRAHIGKHADCWALFLTRGNWLTLRATNGEHKPLAMEPHIGTVWCPNVKSGFWLARRKGKPFITGNTFPPELVQRALLAGCPEGGLVLDPFGGAGTSGLVADRMGLDAILIELNPASNDIARRRITGDCPMFAEVAAE